MKRAVLKALAVLFGGLLIVMLPAGAWANGKAQPPKEEVVYVKLLPDGSADTGYVINGFELSEDMSFVDYGDYQQAINLSTLDPLTVADGAVSISAPGGAFYYQGNLKSTQLPWSIDIRYYLNGSPVSAQQTAGASGNMKIVLYVRDNADVNPVFIENYALQIEMTLNTKTCTDIAASGATIAAGGQDKVVNFIRMPGGDAYSQYSVTMTVSDFEMEGIRIVGIPFSISVDMPDTDELLEDLTALSDGISDLNDGAAALSAGGGQLQDGYNQFHTGLVQMQAALNEINAGLSQLVGGNAELEGGLNQFEQALLSMQANLAEFGESSVDLGELVTGSGAVLDGINQLDAGLAGLQESFDLTDQAVYEMTGHAYEGLQQANEGTILLLTQQIEDLMVDPAGNAEQIEQLTMIVQLLGANNELIAGLNTGINGDGTPENPGLSYAAGTLAAQYQQIDEAIMGLPTMLGDVMDGIAQLKAGIDQMVPNFSALKGGLIEYLYGTLSIQQGFGALCSSFGDVVSGSADMKTSIAMLREGLKDLAEGTGDLHEETWDMDDQFQARIDEMLLEYMSSSFDAVSFASQKNTNVVSVQFVMMTEAITKPEPESEPEPEPVQLTLWQRFMALFGWSDQT